MVVVFSLNFTIMVDLILLTIFEMALPHLFNFRMAASYYSFICSSSIAPIPNFSPSYHLFISCTLSSLPLPDGFQI